jgi:hypothetical protein
LELQLLLGDSTRQHRHQVMLLLLWLRLLLQCARCSTTWVVGWQPWNP